MSRTDQGWQYHQSTYPDRYLHPCGPPSSSFLSTMCLHLLDGGPVGLSQGSVMSPSSKSAVWQQDDCSCWPVQNFFHGILWDRTSRMVMICWFWMILTHTGHRWVQRSGVPMVDSWPVGLSHVCTYVYAHMCHVWAPEDDGSNSSHPLSCDVPSTGTQDSYPPPLPVICQVM